MDGRQKPNERKQKKKNEMAEFQTPSNSFSSKIYERQDDKNKVETFKKIHVLLFPGKPAHTKNLQKFLSFFDVRFLFWLVVPSLLTYSNLFIV